MGLLFGESPQEKYEREQLRARTFSQLIKAETSVQRLLIRVAELEVENRCLKEQLK